MKYLDVYPDCKGCPVAQYCGTMIQSIELCNSYEDKQKELKSEQAFYDSLEPENLL